MFRWMQRGMAVLLVAMLSLSGGCGSEDDDNDTLLNPPSAPDGNVGGNAPPTAFAGADRRVAAGEEVRLDATGSSDPDGDPLSFRWTLLFRPEGSAAELTGETTATPLLRPDLPGVYRIRLEASDGQATDEDDVEIIVESSTEGLPADAGPDRTVPVGAIVRLDGSRSRGPGGGLLRFSWVFLQRPAGSTAVLLPADTPTVSFIADETGIYLVQLTVSDENGASASDTVRIAAGTVTGQAIYDERCALCHSLGNYDRTSSADAPNLSGRDARIPIVFAVAHAGITLTPEEIAAVRTFVDSR